MGVKPQSAGVKALQLSMELSLSNENFFNPQSKVSDTVPFGITTLANSSQLHKQWWPIGLSTHRCSGDFFVDAVCSLMATPTHRMGANQE